MPSSHPAVQKRINIYNLRNWTGRGRQKRVFISQSVYPKTVTFPLERPHFMCVCLRQRCSGTVFILSRCVFIGKLRSNLIICDLKTYYLKKITIHAHISDLMQEGFGKGYEIQCVWFTPLLSFQIWFYSCLRVIGNNFAQWRFGVRDEQTTCTYLYFFAMTLTF